MRLDARMTSAWGAGALSVLLLCGVVATARPAHAAGDWNDQKIKWQPYEAGLKAAKKSKQPVCLVFYTDWCPHCKNYSGVFHDPKVIELAKRFVMIRVNGDQNKDISQQYAPDGQYIPRTFFLAPDGKLEATIQLPRPQFRYFYDEHNPASLLAAMEDALKKLR